MEGNQKADLKTLSDEFEQLKKELQTQSSHNAFNEINLVNAEGLISTKEQVIEALQHHIKFLVSFHQTLLQIATSNVTKQNVIQNNNSNKNSKKLCFGFQKIKCTNVQCKFDHAVTSSRFVQAGKVCKRGIRCHFSHIINTPNMSSSVNYIQFKLNSHSAVTFSYITNTTTSDSKSDKTII